MCMCVCVSVCVFSKGGLRILIYSGGAHSHPDIILLIILILIPGTILVPFFAPLFLDCMTLSDSTHLTHPT